MSSLKTPPRVFQLLWKLRMWIETVDRVGVSVEESSGRSTRRRSHAHEISRKRLTVTMKKTFKVSLLSDHAYAENSFILT